MQWKMVPPELDDGINPTHFSFLWSPGSPESRASVAAGHLPEMHVWVGLPDSGELVDFSTGAFRKLAQERFGLRWLSLDPLRIPAQIGHDSDFIRTVIRELFGRFSGTVGTVSEMGRNDPVGGG